MAATVRRTRERFMYSIQNQIPISNGKKYQIEKVKYCIAKDFKFIYAYMIYWLPECFSTKALYSVCLKFPKLTVLNLA